MVIVHNTAVGTNRNIDSRFFKVIIAGFCDLNKRRRLPPSYTLRFAGNTDGTTADTDLDKIGSCVR